uniref:Reverse transcriptase Ty1/copia-type domain-containing protein n=1 Tax=Solanum lycopersicum TaxID=4081 RepID=A0A3Q7GFS2_SOLLC
MQAPRHLHLVVIRRILRYLLRTTTRGLFFSSGSLIHLNDFIDSYWVGCSDTRCSVCGCCIFGVINYFLGIEFHQTEDEIFISQRKYAKDLLIKFGLVNCKPGATPMNIGEKLQLHGGTEMDDVRSFRSMVGGLTYLTHTRPDIAVLCLCYIQVYATTFKG